MAINKTFDSQRVQVPGDPAIYLVDAGKRRHIPDPQTYSNLFRDQNGIVSDTGVVGIDIGTPISNGAVLAQAYGDSAVFLIDQGHKRHIASPATMDRYYFAYNKINHVAPIILASIPNGTPIVWPE